MNDYWAVCNTCLPWTRPLLGYFEGYGVARSSKHLAETAEESRIRVSHLQRMSPVIERSPIRMGSQTDRPLLFHTKSQIAGNGGTSSSRRTTVPVDAGPHRGTSKNWVS